LVFWSRLKLAVVLSWNLAELFLLFKETQIWLQTGWCAVTFTCFLILNYRTFFMVMSKNTTPRKHDFSYNPCLSYSPLLGTFMYTLFRKCKFASCVSS
jgi:hypothetical protein